MKCKIEIEAIDTTVNRIYYWTMSREIIIIVLHSGFGVRNLYPFYRESVWDPRLPGQTLVFNVSVQILNHHYSGWYTKRQSRDSGNNFLY